MLYFMSRDQQQAPRLFLRYWAKWSIILPWAIPGAVLLLCMGFAALLGNSPLEAGAKLASAIGADWAMLNIQLWLTAFFVSIVCYGVGRQLVGLTARHSLSAPLAALYGWLIHKATRIIRSLSLSLSPALLAGLTFNPGLYGLFYRPGPTGLLPPARLPVPAPLLE